MIYRFTVLISWLGCYGPHFQERCTKHCRRHREPQTPYFRPPGRYRGKKECFRWRYGSNVAWFETCRLKHLKIWSCSVCCCTSEFQNGGIPRQVLVSNSLFRIISRTASKLSGILLMLGFPRPSPPFLPSCSTLLVVTLEELALS